jgi:hypothetical protein
MNEEPEMTPEDEALEAEPQAAKTGAEAWKERRALIVERGAAARERSAAPSNRAANRVADQRRLNADREAKQQRAMNGGRTQRRARG